MEHGAKSRGQRAGASTIFYKSVNLLQPHIDSCNSCNSWIKKRTEHSAQCTEHGAKSTGIAGSDYLKLVAFIL